MGKVTSWLRNLLLGQQKMPRKFAECQSDIREAKVRRMRKATGRHFIRREVDEWLEK